ncbi:hypothetical protein [Chondromyces crocatus]|uniref:Uncharacterized protein n=1 Tax=Chondromyces crocatus TaxID=52 RepID=A0A0K1EPL5_CHOCO|nr:hypothetical protein [Chondromyces crocatus]AKT42865.1 uncharacterized protein CMC5_070930 [Chondromyces crocatus]
MADDIEAKLRELGRGTEALGPSEDFTEVVMAAVAAEGGAPALGRLAQTTRELAPSPEFTDEVMASLGAASDPLERLRQATEALSPESALTEAVMRSVERVAAAEGGGGWLEGVARSGRLGVALAAVAAAACVLLSFQDARALDLEALSSIEAVEVAE